MHRRREGGKGPWPFLDFPKMPPLLVFNVKSLKYKQSLTAKFVVALNYNLT